MKTLPLGPFLGLNNRRQPFALRVPDKGDFLAVAVDVDLDAAGYLKRRRGRTLIQAMTGAHSYWSNGVIELLVRDSVLYAIDSAGYSETLLKLLASDDPVSYVEYADSVYYSNGTDCGRIAGGVWYPWALPTPAEPACATIAGTLPAGKYGVGVAYYNDTTGEEGGVSVLTQHVLDAAGAIRVTLPVATPGATHVRLYVTKLNGDVPGLAATLAAGTAAADVTTTDTTQTASLDYVEPLPAGHRLFVHMGRLCSAKGGMLYYSDPYRLGYYQPARNFIPFPADISIAIPNQMGAYVAADKTYWIPGDLATPDGPIVDVLPYGAVPGTEFAWPQASKVGWMGGRGFVVAGMQGDAEAPMTEQVNVSLPARGCSHVVDDGESFRAVSCGYVMNLGTGAVTQYQNYPVTSASNGLATLPDGLYLLDGDDDAGEVIAWRAGFGKINFGVEQKKRMPACYLGVASSDLLELTIRTNDYPDGFTYEARASDSELGMQRIDPGLGLEATWFELELSSATGADFTLASVSFAPTASTRRI